MSNKCIQDIFPELDARHTELVKAGMSDRGAIIAVILEEHKKLYNTLNNLKKNVVDDLKRNRKNTKLKVDEAKYTPEENLLKLFNIEKEYNRKIDEVSSRIEEKETETYAIENAGEELRKIRSTNPKKGREKGLRIKTSSPILDTEDWNKVESFLKKNFPNIPIYRVKNIIQVGGELAWGMFKDGAIYIYENAEVGTAYHEVFEGVWKMFASQEEQVAIINEFRNRGGKFTDRPSGKKYKYSDKEVTPQMIKEQLAEEFRDYVQNRKIPFKPEKGRPYILKLFSDLLDFIKKIFLTRGESSRIEQMFKGISGGKYRNIIPYETNLSYAKRGIISIDDIYVRGDEDFSLARMRDDQRADIIQHMTYLTLRDLVDKDESLFIGVRKTKQELYDDLKRRIIETIDNKADRDSENAIESVKKIIKEKADILALEVIRQWDDIVARHEEYLMSYKIEFDENDALQIVDAEKGRDETLADANKIDHLKKANSALRMILSTIPIVDEDGYLEDSTIGGAKLIPLGEVNATLLNKLHNSRTPEEMLSKLRNLASDDRNYKALYYRLTRQNADLGIGERGENIDLSETYSEHGNRLLASFYSLFSKANPEVVNLYILGNGEVVIGNAHLSTAASQLADDFIHSIIKRARERDSYFIYDTKKKVYRGDPSKLINVKTSSIEASVRFLNNLGIPLVYKDVRNGLIKNKRLRPKFDEAVDGILKSLRDGEDIMTFSGRSLNIAGRLLELGYIQAAIANPTIDTTFFDLNNERTQSFIGTNASSDLYKHLSQTTDLVQLIDSPYAYILTDPFVVLPDGRSSSVIINKIFTPEGPRVESNSKNKVDQLLSSIYVGGTEDQQRGRRRKSARLAYKQRLIQEINLNLDGYYLNLVPGDANMEWAVYMGNHIKKTSDAVLIFRDYFISERELAKTEGRYVAKGRNADEMRFFKDILGKELHDGIMADKRDSETIYNSKEYNSKINTAIDRYVSNQRYKLISLLEAYGILEETEKGYSFENINIPDNISQSDLNNRIDLLNLNYMVANIEMHKLLYSDPYQYTDELKRIKNFLSPRQTLINNSPKMNEAFDSVWNGGFDEKGIGWTNFHQEYFRTVAYQDIMGILPDLVGYTDPYKETDGAGIISLKAYRHFKIRLGEWDDNMERQYKHDMQYERMKVAGESEDVLIEFEKNNPKVAGAYTPIKPIVAGNKADGQEYNNIVLDKFALYPMSLRLLDSINRTAGKTTSNNVHLYNKMMNENIDYIIFENGRKVGASNLPSIYNEESGDFNNEEFSKESIVNVPFSAVSMQTEVPTKEEPTTTTGSQATKLVTLDMMEAGVPVDFMKGSTFTDRYKAWNTSDSNERKEYDKKDNTLYKEIKKNEELLKELITLGYYQLLSDLGIQEKDGKYIADLSKAHKTLREEILKREVNDNISAALDGFIKGKVVLEATPAYQQVRNILYSLADRNVISRKITGGYKVQIPVSGFEENKVRMADINGKKGYVSDTLNFYTDEDGKRVCQIMVKRWFKSDMSDKELLTYFKTKEGKEALSGIAFRIPTQKQNSIDRFEIAQFLPEEFGDVVVVPSQIVVKAGSDFDIDKLTLYFKNLYKDANGTIHIVPYYGRGREAFIQMAQLAKDIIDEKTLLTDDKINSLSKLQSLFGDIALGIASSKTAAKWIPIFKEWFADKLVDGKLPVATIENFFIKKLEKLNKKLDDLTNEDLIEVMVNEMARDMYRKSLENEYISSMENLVSHPENFDRLITPNSAEYLKGLAKQITGKETDYLNVGNMLDREYMSKLRHAFVIGKYAIGIAAVNQTNHALNQRQLIYIDPNRRSLAKKEDRRWLGDGKLRFEKFNKIEVNGEMLATLSMIKDAEGRDISDIISQIIDGYVDISKGPWIIELGITPNVTGTWLFLIKAGVPVDTVAYFMNQPIIKDYLRNIENAGYTWLFMDSFVEKVKEDYDSGRKYSATQTRIPSRNKLKDMLNKTADKMSVDEKDQQTFILDEFLKYAKMAEHLFHVTQGTNFDTANFNDPYLIFKKLEQFKKAQQSIISDADSILANSFLSHLGMTIQDMRKALSSILRSDRKRITEIIHKVIAPYVNMNDRDFVRIAQKAVADLFDYAVQIDQKFNTRLRSLLITNGGVAKRVADFLDTIDEKHYLYGNQVVKNLKVRLAAESDRTLNSVNNIQIKGGNRIYDQNSLIYAFRQLKEYLRGKSSLYDDIVALAVVQSGLSRSTYSMLSVLPYEDFEKVYNSTLSKIETVRGLENFVTINAFQRNNWNNEDIVPNEKAMWIKTKKGDWLYNLPMSFFDYKHVNNAVEAGKIPPVVAIRQTDRQSESNHIVYTWEKEKELFTSKELQGKSEKEIRAMAKDRKAEMRKRGDTSYINRALFEKVTEEDGTPFEISYKKDGKPVYQYVYKAINPWGAGHKANEFYSVEKPSIIDNGLMKVVIRDKSLSKEEQLDDLGFQNGTVKLVESMSNKDIIDIFLKRKQKEAENISHEGINISREELLEDYSQKTGAVLGKRLNNPSEFVNHSGGAIGSDSTWDNIGREFGVTNHKHYYYKDKTPKGNTPITTEQLEEGWKHVLEANKTLKRKPEGYKSLLSRNWFQVKNADAIYAIGTIDFNKEGEPVDGGTGWAVQMAKDVGKLVFVFDTKSNKWWRYDRVALRFLSYDSTPTLTKNFAGIGTRGINGNIGDAAKKAIRDVYTETFKREEDEDWQNKDNSCPVPF